MQWTGLQKQSEGERALQVANSLGKDTPQTGINTQPQMQLDIHLLNTYDMLSAVVSPKMDRALPPENRLGSKWLTDSAPAGTMTEKGTHAQRGGGQQIEATHSFYYLPCICCVGKGEKWNKANGMAAN